MALLLHKQGLVATGVATTVVCPYVPVLKMSSSVNREVSYAYLHPSYLNHGLVWKISEKGSRESKENLTTCRAKYKEKALKF